MNNYNWSVISRSGVDKAIAGTAAKVAERYELESEDLAQEARIRVADRSKNLAECLVDPDNIGLFRYRLEQDLVDIAKVLVAKRDRNTSYEERYDTGGDIDSGDFAPRPASIAIRTEVVGYTRELVESLIPAVWDESFCYGIRVENAPDADMPRGSMNKATGNTLAAHIADIKTGWKKAPLTLKERRALLLGYAMDWTQKEIGENQGVTQEMISRRQARGVGKIVSALNDRPNAPSVARIDLVPARLSVESVAA